jgi:polyphosphate kinase 2 (PPK2 family)
MLIESGTLLIKFYFSISKEEQEKRFEEIKSSPIKKWKYSEVDRNALALWDDYTLYKKRMFRKTNTQISPWIIIKANKKTKARIYVIEYVLAKTPYTPKNQKLIKHIEIEAD